MPSLPSERGLLRMRVRVVGEHPRVVEAMRILARILLRTAGEKGLDSVSSLSPHVARGDAAAKEKCA